MFREQYGEYVYWCYILGADNIFKINYSLKWFKIKTTSA